jgi:hypothetical protein
MQEREHEAAGREGAPAAPDQLSDAIWSESMPLPPHSAGAEPNARSSLADDLRRDLEGDDDVAMALDTAMLERLFGPSVTVSSVMVPATDPAIPCGSPAEVVIAEHEWAQAETLMAAALGGTQMAAAAPPGKDLTALLFREEEAAVADLGWSAAPSAAAEADVALLFQDGNPAAMQLVGLLVDGAFHDRLDHDLRFAPGVADRLSALPDASRAQELARRAAGKIEDAGRLVDGVRERLGVAIAAGHRAQADLGWRAAAGAARTPQ